MTGGRRGIGSHNPNHPVDPWGPPPERGPDSPREVRPLWRPSIGNARSDMSDDRGSGPTPARQGPGVGSGVMMVSIEQPFLALHGLRLRGFADTAALSALLGVSPDVVEPVLTAATQQGLVARRDGARSGWLLTPTGRAEHERLAAAELDRSGQRTPLTHCYEAFRPLNRRFLELCTRWQVRTVEGTATVNDHTDPAHDRAVLDELVAIDSELMPLVGKLEAVLDRFRLHGSRFDNALVRVLDGDYDWLASPVLDSYHTVWFELHEDLLVTLGLDRAAETAAVDDPR